MKKEENLNDIKKPLFSGKVAFTLYDTYGFPLDLTQSILRDKGIEIDITEFEEAMAEQKRQAKEAWVGSGDVKNNEIYFKIKDKISPTEFLGYDSNTATAKILHIIKDGKEVKEVNAGDEFEFFVNKTPFYGECGGQVGDSGLGIQINEDGVIPLPFSIIEILDVKRPFNDYFLHKAKLENGKIKVGDFVNLSINQERRKRIRANHSSAHLLQFALRKVFGNTVSQKGSYVDENRLRFDFTLNKPIQREQLREVENIVNDLIFKDTPIITKIMGIDEAKGCGALALFNEKYQDEVRVLFMGEKSNEDIIKEKKEFSQNSIDAVSDGLHSLNNASLKEFCSIELCGGTHAFKTGDLGFFKIVSECSVASGIRRIEAVTGFEALKYMNKLQDIVVDVDEILEVGYNNIVEKVKTIHDESKLLKKQIENIKKANISSMTFTEENNGIMFAYSIMKDVDPKDIKGAFIDIQNKKYNEKSVLLCITKFDGKLTIILGASKDLNDKFKANDIIKKAVEVAGGNGGGGQPWFAMGGATDNNQPVVIQNIINIVRESIN